MKTATIPSLRVDPELREAIESVLEKGETLSSFVEQSVKTQVERRRSQSEFLARGFLHKQEATRTGEYYSADVVMGELQTMLATAEAKAAL